MKPLSLTGLLRRIAQVLAQPSADRQRPGPSAGEAGGHAGDRRRHANRLVLVRIAFNFGLILLLAGVETNVDHVRALSQLLFICGNVACVLALICRQPVSLVDLNRWDEAIIFITIGLGLRIFA